MSLTDHDLETLEELLDGELPVEQADLLRRRLSTEPELAQAMDRLRTDRQMRAAIWSALEPGDRQVEAIIHNVCREVNRHELWSARYRTLRSVTGVAAAIAMVFTAGWISSRRLQYNPTDVPSANALAVNDASSPIRNVVATPAMQINPYPVVTSPRNTNRNGGGGFDLSSNPIVNVSDHIPLPSDANNELFNGPANSNAISNVRPSYTVVVIDPWGRVVDRQQFGTRDDAQKFTEQLNRFQGRQLQNTQRRGADNVIPVTDQP